jgi:iron(III) transport system substrate-binding protein
MRIVKLCGVAVLALPGVALAQVPESLPDYYPESYAEVVDAGRAEGSLVIYAPLDATAARPLIDDFNELYPEITVEYNDLSTTVLHNRFLSEAAAGASTADFVWSSAMDFQVQLVNDGYALTYQSPEIPEIPEWAVWQDQAYGTTFEPIVFIYNKSELPEALVPQTHPEVPQVMLKNPDAFMGRVANYDIETSGIGFLTVAQDSESFETFWDVPKAFGTVDARFISGSGTMIESVGSGENVFAYNQLGAYARRVSDNPDVGVIFPSDYTLVVSRVAFIPADAPHPNAAKLFLDYILSQRGQEIIAGDTGLYSLRSDVEGQYAAKALTEKLGDAIKPVRIGPELLEYLQPEKRVAFLDRWLQAIREAQ